MGILNFTKTTKTAQPAFFRDPFFPSADAVECEYPRLQYHFLQSHGLYVCCCGHDNELKLRAGKSPFLELTCGKCNHVLCSECRTSDIIVPFDKDKWSFWYGLPSVTLSKHELFQVCSSCGLSAHAESRGAHPRWPLKCNGCSASGTTDWRKYIINPRPSQPSAKMLDDLKMARIVQKAAAQGLTLEHVGSGPQYAQPLKASHEHDTSKVALRPTLSLQQLQKSSLLDYHIVHDQEVTEHRPDPILVANPGSFLTRRNAVRGRTSRSASSGSLIAARPHPLRAETLPSKVPDEKKWVAMRELMDKHNVENVVDLLSNPK